MTMRLPRRAGLLFVVLPLTALACSKEPKKSAEPEARPVTPAAPAPEASGAKGAGDGSGASIADAKGLARGAPVTFEVPCERRFVVGPFAFTHDPEKVVVHAKAKSLKGEQICVGGRWADARGGHAQVAGIGCPEGTHVSEQDVVFEYSPGNGGNGANPVYLEIGFDAPQPKGCAIASVTLSLGS